MAPPTVTQTSSSDEILVDQVAEKPPKGPLGWIRRLYDWVLHWADTPYGLSALIGLSFIEAIFFPIPPDVLLIALVLGARQKWFKFALGCTLASALGGCVGYWIGVEMWAQLADTFYHYVPGFTEHKFQKIQGWYKEWDFWVVFTAGFTPIPYKVITISAGSFNVNFIIFVLASILSRGARFFLVSYLLNRYGEPIREWIEERFNLLSMLFMTLLIGGFALVKFLL